MSNIVIYACNKGKSCFKVNGHATYVNPETQNNDVCVAISTLVSMFGRWLEHRYGILPVGYGDGTIEFSIAETPPNIAEMLEAIGYELEWLEQQYPDIIKVKHSD